MQSSVVVNRRDSFLFVSYGTWYLPPAPEADEDDEVEADVVPGKLVSPAGILELR